MSGVVTVPGTPITFPGRGELIVPPLALGDLEQLQERIASYQGGLDKESVATVIDAAHAALRQNYPALTREDVGRLVNLGNMFQVFKAVMTVSGLERKEKGPGEPPAPASPSTGAISTLT